MFISLISNVGGALIEITLLWNYFINTANFLTVNHICNFQKFPEDNVAHPITRKLIPIFFLLFTSILAIAISIDSTSALRILLWTVTWASLLTNLSSLLRFRPMERIKTLLNVLFYSRCNLLWIPITNAETVISFSPNNLLSSWQYCCVGRSLQLETSFALRHFVWLVID